MGTTDILRDTKTKLQRISWLSERGNEEFRWLMHHYNETSLKECFYELDANKAVGVDGINKSQYRVNLDENIEKLIARMRKMAYRPGPVREVKIPKENGTYRSLGISNIEDKIVQRMTAKILNAIYEPIFKDGSYGFRPGRSCHKAIKSLQAYLFRNKVETVIDVDLKKLLWKY